MVKQCLDYYRETLKIGDFVIPIYKDALENQICGTITKIYNNLNDGYQYITISDNDGNVLLKNVNSRFYTTRERQDIRDNKKYVYRLTCFDKNCRRIGYLPLTNTTDINYSIPSNTCYVILEGYHLDYKGSKRVMRSYLYSYLYYFVLKNRIEVKYYEKSGNYALRNPASYIIPEYIGKDVRFFESDEELQLYIRNIILYFRDADLTLINNEKEFDKNPTKQAFEEQLLQRFKNHK